MGEVLMDLILLVWESARLSMPGIALGKWILVSLVVAAISFGLNLFFVRLWNRLYEFRPWHFVLFGIAALGAAAGTIALPATAKLREAVQDRVSDWENMATNSKVDIEEAWNEELIKSGLPAGTEKIPWSLGLGFRTRIRLIEAGYDQGPVTPIVVVNSPGDGAAERIEFELMLASFEAQSPAVFSRVDIPVEELSVRYWEWSQGELERRKDPSTGVSSIPYATIAGKVAEYLLDATEPQVPSIARAIRVFAILMLLLSVAFPTLLLGIISYSQIKVGFDRRSRGDREWGRGRASGARRRSAGRGGRRNGRMRATGRTRRRE